MGADVLLKDLSLGPAAHLHLHLQVCLPEGLMSFVCRSPVRNLPKEKTLTSTCCTSQPSASSSPSCLLHSRSVCGASALFEPPEVQTCSTWGHLDMVLIPVDVSLAQMLHLRSDDVFPVFFFYICRSYQRTVFCWSTCQQLESSPVDTLIMKVGS